MLMELQDSEGKLMIVAKIILSFFLQIFLFTAK